MSWVEKLLDEAGPAAAARGVTLLGRGTLRVEGGGPEELGSADAVLGRMRAFGGKGWVCWVSRPERPDGGDAVIVVDDARSLPEGTVLWAELVAGDVSLHVRYVGPRWAATTLRRVVDGPPEHWLFAHEMVRDGGGLLRYEVAWREEAINEPDGDGAGGDAGRVWRPWAARLAGMDDGQG